SCRFTNNTTTHHSYVGTTLSANTTHQHTGATLRLGVVVSTGHRGKPAGHLTHGCQQRQCTTTGHSFVCECGDLGIQDGLGAFSRGRQVQVGEQNLAFAHLREFLTHRFFDLQDHFCAFTNLGCVLDEVFPG